MKKMTNKRRAAFFLTLIPVLAVMGVIFYFSSQTAEASTVTSGGYVERVMELIERFFGEISAGAYGNIEGTVTFLVRKAAHFLEFAALGFFVAVNANTYAEKRAWLISGAVSVLYACSDELHQHFVSERAPRFFDVCVDSLGAFCAIAAVCIAVTLYRKRKGRKDLS